jgi:selenide,water dikinase
MGDEQSGSGTTGFRLTDRARAAGCAAKLGPADLSRILRALPPVVHPDLLVGTETSDDAGVFRIAPDLALVQTVDFFTPIVDDAFQFGMIAAANALSDVYAMGGEPRTALNIACFPQQGVPFEVLGAILEGGLAKAAEAGVLVVGGHTVIDEEIKFGMAVTGFVHPERILRNVGARPGDVLFLTKALGTGIITTACKRGGGTPAELAAAVESMTTLNASAARALRELTVNACTDVTGFGLFGHAYEMAYGSGVQHVFEAARLPLLPGARALAAAGHLTGGCRRNRDWLGDKVAIASTVPPDLAELAWDPQTSGGLLVAVPEAEAGRLEAAFTAAGVPGRRVGRVEARHEGPFVVLR